MTRHWRAPLAIPLAIGCTAVRSPHEVNAHLRDAVAAAQRHARKDETIEASVLLAVVEATNAEFPGLAELKSTLSPDALRLLDKPYLGSNKAVRVRARRSGAQRAMLYIPDRLLDLIDLVTFDVHLGTGLYLNAHATRAAQAGLGVRATAGLGAHSHRSVGMQGQAEGSTAIGPVGTLAYAGGTVGTSGVRATSDAFSGLHRPTGQIYQEYWDYWGVGVAAMLLVVGVEADFHPVQLADFFAGFAEVDFLCDDFAQTKGLNFTAKDRQILRSIGQVRQSRETARRYREWLEDGGRP